MKLFTQLEPCEDINNFKVADAVYHMCMRDLDLDAKTIALMILEQTNLDERKRKNEIRNT